ncbi:MAG TPA: sulfotransferase [Patescibacteria group bacterium]|nr:sulfotransferase [Patescibacteria group bacterium]
MRVQADSPVAKLYDQAIRCIKAGRAPDAVKLLQQAIELYPSSGDLHAQLAGALSLSGDIDGAVEEYKKACRLSPKQPHIHFACAQYLLQTNNVAEAEKYFRKTFTLSPDIPDAIAHVGLCLQRQKKVDEAEKAFQQTLEIDPDNVHALYGLGQIYDARDEAAKAFEYFKRSKAVQAADMMAKAMSPRAMPAVISRFRRLTASRETDSWKAVPMPEDWPRLVFLVGFPRSGTTLLDQILSGHPDIEVAEERNGLAYPGNFIIKTKKKTVPEALSSLTADEISDLRRMYFKAMKEMGFKLRHGSVFIDKLPLNLVYAPFIHRLFPEAKFILALRHPCDSVLSCFMQPFQLNESMMHFLDIENAAKFYDLSFSAWEEAAAALKLKYHTVRYENVVSDLKSEVDAALKFLELDWHEGMENFDQTAHGRRIKTPSASQVSQKIYTRAKGRWHKYREYMGKAPDILRPWIEKYGYEFE